MNIVSAIAGSAAVMIGSTAFGGVFQTINLQDGSLDEWDSGALFYSNAEIGDASNADAAYNAIYVANDADNLYIGIRTDGAAGGTIFNAWTHNLYLDTDLNGDTGYDGGWMTNGYDFLAQYGAGGTFSVYAFGGDANEQAPWLWNFVNTFDYGFSGDVIEWRIPLAHLGNPEAVVMTSNVPYALQDETWANADESLSKTYTFAVPEPASLALLASTGLLLGLRRRR